MDIISLPIQGDFVNTHSRYRLVVLATQRARQLMEGDKPTLLTRYTKPTTIAVAEILSGQLEILHGKDALQYQHEARRAREERKNRFLTPEREEELRKEIKKDLSVYLSDAAGKEQTLKEDTKSEEIVK
ncbi:MAG: DNA-directed RNA polymerase subunit omega [Nitrospirae bacterium]|nr:DNA-directed RNA polymerase subunit omega [Candidatus Troglogloeales bacterium]